MPHCPHLEFDQIISLSWYFSRNSQFTSDRALAAEYWTIFMLSEIGLEMKFTLHLQLMLSQHSMYAETKACLNCLQFLTIAMYLFLCTRNQFSSYFRVKDINTVRHMYAHLRVNGCRPQRYHSISNVLNLLMWTGNFQWNFQSSCRLIYLRHYTYINDEIYVPL